MGIWWLCAVLFLGYLFFLRLTYMTTATVAAETAKTKPM